MSLPGLAEARGMSVILPARSGSFFLPEMTGKFLFDLTDVMSVFLCPAKIKIKGMKK